MLENQFIDLRNESFANAKLRHAFLVDVTQAIEIFTDNSNGYTTKSIAALNLSGTEISSSNVQSEVAFSIFRDGEYLEDLEDLISPGDKFILRVIMQKTGSSDKSYRSQPLIYADLSTYSFLRYRCYDEAFGFKFIGGNFASVQLPLRLHSPQNVQDDKTYVKANGGVVTLYAKYYKEWEGETEFLSAEMHDKIVAALSCDEVYIDGKRVTKSDNYQVDWENYDLDCDGVTKLARATFKVRENTNQRNSNF